MTSLLEVEQAGVRGAAIFRSDTAPHLSRGHETIAVRSPTVFVYYSFVSFSVAPHSQVPPPPPPGHRATAAGAAQVCPRVTRLGPTQLGNYAYYVSCPAPPSPTTVGIFLPYARNQLSPLSPTHTLSRTQRVTQCTRLPLHCPLFCEHGCKGQSLHACKIASILTSSRGHRDQLGVATHNSGTVFRLQGP